MATRGRKTKRTPEVEKRILDALRVGATQRDASAAAGIDEDTLCNWKRDFSDFSEAVSRAEGACAVTMAAKIYEAGRNGDWKAAESWLKRRRRTEWGDSIDLHKLSDDELIARATGAIAGVIAPGADTSAEKE